MKVVVAVEFGTTTRGKGMDYKTYVVIQRQEMENKKKEEIKTVSEPKSLFIFQEEDVGANIL